MKFALNEMVVIVNLAPSSYAGDEVEIVGLNEPPSASYPKPYYLVETRDGPLGAAEIHLRKKQPPAEELSSWEDIEKSTGWSPKIAVTG